MKILFLAPRLPLPADTGGKIRTLNILKQLAKRSQILLVCFSFSKEDKRYAKELEQMGIKVSMISFEEHGMGKKMSNVIFNPMPYSIYKYLHPEMKSYLMDLNQRERFDAVHIDHLHMAHYRSCFSQVSSYLDEHNVEYKILERCVGVEKNIFKKYLYSSQARKMRHFEGLQSQKFTHCFTVSEDDKNILQSLTKGKVLVDVIANGVDTEYFQSIEMKEYHNEDFLVFTGSMDWLPNDDAVIYFCEKVLPIIWMKNKLVKFYIVGKDPSKKVVELGQYDSRIIVTGRVDDVRKYMSQSKVFVVPIRVGGGTRLKILEAMSMGQAVVSTSVGAEGINYTHDQNIMIADKPEDFAQAVLELLDNSGKRHSLGVSARELVCEQYDWNVVGEKLNRIYREGCLK